jgi:hypothetical protein
MIACLLPLRVVEGEAIVPGTGDDEYDAADLPVTAVEPHGNGNERSTKDNY